MDYSSERAADALAFIQESRVRLVAASDTPPSRHMAFAGLMGGWIAAPALPLAWRFAALACLIAGVALVVRWDKRRTGMFINGYRAGRTRRVTAAMLLCLLPLYLLSSWLAIEHKQVWGPVALGVVAGGLSYAASVWWCRVFRREMLDGVR